MQLSKKESELYEALKKGSLDIFRVKDICLLLDIKKQAAYNLIKALKKKNAIEVIHAGLYAVKGVDDIAIGTSLNWPSYLSFRSALSYYGMTDQMPKKIIFASSRYRKETSRFKYVALHGKRFFGYKAIGEIIIAEKEKAIIDSLLFPKHAGGMREVMQAIRNSINIIDMQKLETYALKMKSKAVIRRLGFLLEEAGFKKATLLNHLGKGYELLDPTMKRKNNLNKKWLLDINW